MFDLSLDERQDYIIDEASYILQQVELLLDSNKGDLLGYYEAGTNYRDCLYNLGFTDNQLREKVLSDLAGLDLRGWRRNVNVYMMQGTERDIAVVEILLYDKSNNGYQYNFKIE